LDSALILCADHELNISSFTARCVASAGSTPYAAVVAALAALQGHKHGGVGERVSAFLDLAATDPQRAVRDCLRRGEALPGFGHQLYPAGDPRGRLLLEMAHNARPAAPILAVAEAVVATADQAIQVAPNLDFGLAVLARALALPVYTPFTLFALGRTAGWIGHIIEQYGVNQLIRPRSRYVGVQPHP
jgi:citrate synthase